MSKTLIVFDYTNYKGVRSRRTVEPIAVWFGSTEHHPEEQWFLHALDFDKKEERDFPLQAIVQDDRRTK